MIFDLDGTLALIDERRERATRENGKMNWDVFFDPELIKTDKPNTPIIELAKVFDEAGVDVIIFSGRSESTKNETIKWLRDHLVPFTFIRMRPTTQEERFTPDDKLKENWLNELFPGESKSRIHCVVDDRDKVVEMWRRNGLTCLQVAPGNF